MSSIVIPAHDEERNIARLLDRLAPLASGPDPVEVVVACNGCTDRTAEVAREAAPWAKVVELTEASKPAALDAGDAAVSSFPRLYLDADITIEADTVRTLFAAVTGEVLAAAAMPRYDLSSSGWLVRSYHQIWERLPTNRTGLNGTNAMAVSEVARARFTTWPALIGDDYFLDGLFSASQKRRVAEAPVIRPGSRGFGDTVSRKARIHQGNLDVLAAGLREQHSESSAGGLVGLLRSRPRLLVHLPAHLAITLSARGLSWWRRRRGTADRWFRDESRR